MITNVFSYSDIGGKEENEDSVCVDERGMRRMYLVCDGLGGHGDGKAASQLVCRCVQRDFFSDFDFSEARIATILQNANRQLIAYNGGGQTAKTTLAGLFIDGDSYIIAHIGDSRVYRFGKMGMRSRTEDHSVPQMQVQLGNIKESDIRNHPDRNRVLRVLGIESVCNPTLVTGKLDSDFDAFLLCSDGFWEYVYDDEMYFDLIGAKGADHWIMNMRMRHLNRIPDDCDNHSAIAVIAHP